MDCPFCSIESVRNQSPSICQPDQHNTVLVRSTVNGHLAWTWQNATGNRGDDLRALRLAELQPFEMLHPDKETEIDTILGMQGQEKAGRKGMKTVRACVYDLPPFIS